MAYSTPGTKATGDQYTAAMWNTNMRDNMSEMWKYASAGDLIYGLTATTANRLAIGAAGSILRSTGSAPSWLAIGSSGYVLTSTGTAPSWASVASLNGVINAIGYDNSIAEFTTTSTTGADVTGLTFNITTTVTCTIALWMFGSMAVSGGSAIWSCGLLGSIGGVNQTLDTSVPRTYAGQYEPYTSFYRRTGVAAGTITCKARAWVEDASRTANYIGGMIFALAITE